MRLQLEICRNRLPAVKILWQTDEETITSQVLSDVDVCVPLQSEEWGLEDYVLETAAGFEALHYQKVGDVVREDDYLRIRPLSTNDLRARRLTARTQINFGGRHLTDGIAYGQPLLRAPARARLQIAPRKSVDWISACDSAFEDLEDVDKELAEDDGDGDDDEDFKSDEDNQDQAVRSQRRSKRLTDTVDEDSSTALVLREEEEDDSEDEDDNFSDASTSEASSSSDSSSSSEMETLSAKGRKRVHWANEVDYASSDIQRSSQATSPLDAPPAKRVKTNSDSPKASNEKPNEDPWQASKRHANVETKETAIVPPGQGSDKTKARNRRRSLAKKLTSLKRQGILPPDADTRTLQDNRAQPLTNGTGDLKNKGNVKYPQTDSSSSSSEEDSSSDGDESEDDSSSESESDNEDSEASSKEDGAPEIASSKPKSNGQSNAQRTNDSKASEDIEFQKRREALLAQLDNGGVEVTETPERQDKTNGVDMSPSAQLIEEAKQSTPDTASRQKKLDVRASTRLLLGSLGQRTPRNATERAALVEKMAATAQKKPIVIEATQPGSKDPVATLIAEKAKNDLKLKILMKKVAAETASKDERERFDKIVAQCREEYEATNKKDDEKSADDIDFWKQHIELTAVECCDEDVKLSTPPFPFYQRWDPSQRKGKKRKRHSQNEEQDDSYFGNGAEGGDGLNYDDEELAEDNEWDAIDEQEEAEIEDDLPTLPEDVSTLAQVKEEDLKTGDVIVFKNLEVSAATGWTPAVSPLRTAKVLSEKLEVGQPITLQLARRDQPERNYDEEGNRVYEKFEMQSGEDGEDEDEGIIELNFADLVDPRLLSSSAEE
ncbi:Hypothetical protein D9617_7g032340 [Elsinoe fawcettii]|nr:Hypothetical protein D9617_7g032340 [Elsinoe fawcettii]